MKVIKRGYLKALLLVCAWGPFFSPAHADVAGIQGRETYVPGEILVRFNEEASLESRLKVLAVVARSENLIRPFLYHVHLVPGQDVAGAVQRMARDPAVKYAQPNYRYYSLGCAAPTDHYYNSPENWPFLKIQAPLAWALFSTCPPGSASITVAVLDSGVSRNHPDMSNVPLVGYNAICDVHDQSPSCTCSGSVSDSAGVTASMDDFGHGTYVAGIIMGGWNSSFLETNSTYYSVCDKTGGPFAYNGSTVNDLGGVAGVAPGVTLLAVKILDCIGSGSTASIVAGTDFAVSMGARVLNYSLGSGPEGGIDPAEKEALDNALANNCVIVAASGNDSRIAAGSLAPVDFPAAYPPVIAVGATDQNDKVADYSNGGINLDLVAPGGSANPFTGDALVDSANKIFGVFLCPMPLASVTECGFEPLISTSGSVTDPFFGVAAGTSASTPFVSAAAALILTMNPNLTYTQVAERIVNNTDSLNGNKGWDTKTGYGRLNLYRALTNSGPDLTTYLKTFNSPNPFYPDMTGSTNITLALTQAEAVELSIWDSGGEMVFHKVYAPGDLNDNPSNPQFKSYFIGWDGRNGAGQPVKTGVYFYAVKANGQVGRNKIAVIRGNK